MESKNQNDLNYNFNEIYFPIPYSTHQITKEQFLIAVEKLMQKFDITVERAAEITEDIIKAMILENKPPSALEHEINALAYAGWDFLREKSIEEVIGMLKK